MFWFRSIGLLMKGNEETKDGTPKNNDGKKCNGSRQESDGEQHLRVNFFFPGQVNFVTGGRCEFEV